MAKMRKAGSGYIIAFTAGITSGFLIGIFIVTSLVSYRIDTYMQKNVQYEAEIQDRELKLKRLEDAVKSKKYVVKDIEVILEFDGHELDRIAIEKFVKDKYNAVLGKEVKNVDADMSLEIIDKIIIRIKTREYRLKPQKLLISETLKIWAKAEELK